MAVAIQNPLDVVERLCQINELHIINAREETFRSGDDSPNKRVSDSSIASDPFDNATPASLDADLAHYKVSIRCGLLTLQLITDGSRICSQS